MNKEAENTTQQRWLQSQACWSLLERLGFQLRQEKEPDDGEEQYFAANRSSILLLEGAVFCSQWEQRFAANGSSVMQPMRVVLRKKQDKHPAADRAAWRQPNWSDECVR